MEKNKTNILKLSPKSNIKIRNQLIGKKYCGTNRLIIRLANKCFSTQEVSRDGKTTTDLPLKCAWQINKSIPLLIYEILMKCLMWLFSSLILGRRDCLR